MNTPLPALQWKQNGVNHIVKLLPGGRIGALSDEILAEIRESNGKLDAKIMAIRSGNVQLVRQLQNEHIYFQTSANLISPERRKRAAVHHHYSLFSILF